MMTMAVAPTSHGARAGQELFGASASTDGKTSATRSPSGWRIDTARKYAGTSSIGTLSTMIGRTCPTGFGHRRFAMLSSLRVKRFGATDAVQIFSANAAAPANGRTPIVQMALTPGASGAKRITFVASCAGGANFRCATQTADLPAGVNRVEVDLQIGAATTTLNYWLNQTGTSEPPATGTIAVTGGNGDWSGGVDTAVMGLGAPSPSFIATHAGQAVQFDTFDSRRNTYIGS